MSFELPEGLVGVESKLDCRTTLWHEENPDVEAQDKPEIEATDEHKQLASRRVRLGLLWPRSVRKKRSSFPKATSARAIMQQAQQFPGQEREFFEYVRNNREALEQIRAPLFEDKVVDLIIEKADVTDVPVSKADLESGNRSAGQRRRIVFDCTARNTERPGDGAFFVSVAIPSTTWLCAGAPHRWQRRCAPRAGVALGRWHFDNGRAVLCERFFSAVGGSRNLA